jgi:hypothetical protein
MLLSKIGVVELVCDVSPCVGRSLADVSGTSSESTVGNVSLCCVSLSYQHKNTTGPIVTYARLNPWFEVKSFLHEAHFSDLRFERIGIQTKKILVSRTTVWFVF